MSDRSYKITVCICAGLAIFTLALYDSSTKTESHDAAAATKCSLSSAEYLKKAERYFQLADKEGWENTPVRNQHDALLASAAAQLHQVCVHLEKE